MERLDEDHQFSTKAMYDMKLVQRAIKDNDQKAYEELMKRYWEPVYFVMLRMLNNNHDNAEDMTMEAFGKAFKFLYQYQRTFAFSTWLFKIASNNAIDYIRQTKMYRGTLSLDKPVENTGEENLSAFIRGKELTPEEFLIRKQTIERVRIIVEKLKPNYREIVELHYIEELTNEEIAERVNLPINTIKTRLHRARELLLTMASRQNRF